MPDNQKVFVSHSSKDETFARKIVSELENRGIPCWFAPRDLPPSVPYPTAIIEATQNASAMIVILSQHASQSEHVCREVERAAHMKKPIFPLKIDNEPLSGGLEYFLAGLQHVDFLKGKRTESFNRLASELEKITPVSFSAGLDRSGGPVWRLNRVWAIGLAAALLVGLTLVSLVLWQRSLRPPNRGGSIESGQKRTSATERFTYRAVVIGISNYRESKMGENAGWSHLPSARGDAEALAKVLEENYGFNVTRLFDEQASRSAILTAFDALATADSNTAALICFAGHGIYEGSRKEGYWIPADARKNIDGRPAREDWIWNSTIQKIVGASEARHILLIADACYAGTLFHPEENRETVSGHASEVERSFADTSRYLIASGGVEEVPDGGHTRSAFMQAVLDEMQVNNKVVPLTAQALGRSVHERLHRETGRDIAVGPLTVSTSLNGQFVFARRGELSQAMLSASSRDSHSNKPAAPVDPASVEEMLSSVLALNREGATNAAIRLLASLSSNKTADDGIVRAVAAYIDHDLRAKAGTEMRALIENLKKVREQQSVAGRAAGQTAPRILACIGPTSPPGSSSDVDNRTMLCRIILQSQVKVSGRAVVVEREQLEQILKEMQLGTTDLSDPRARIALGRILQAGILLFGEYLPGDTEDTLILRLIETETTQLLDSITGTLNPRTPAAACTALGKQLVESMIRACPVQAKCLAAKDRSIRISAGKLHGVAPNAEFDVLAEASAGDKSSWKPFARAVVKQVNEEDSELELVEGNSLGSHDVTSIRVCEVMPVQYDLGK